MRTQNGRVDASGAKVGPRAHIHTYNRTQLPQNAVKMCVRGRTHELAQYNLYIMPENIIKFYMARLGAAAAAQW